MSLYYPPTQNGLQKQLDADLNSGVTASLTLTNTTGVQNKPGVIVVNRIDTSGSELASSVREYISFTGTSGATLTGLARGLGGSSDQDHSTGAVVEFIWDVVAHEEVNTVITNEHATDGTHGDITATTISTTGNATIGGNTDTATLQVATSSVTADDILDEDDMASDSATALATQQSIKAYADTYTNVSSMHRQAIINGNFDVWQRGTSFTPSTGDYVADRWRATYDADGGTLPTDTITKQNEAAGGLEPIVSYLRLSVDGAGSSLGTASHYRIAQRIENGTRLLCGASKTVTLSFYARSDIADKKLGVYANQNYGTGGTPTAQEDINGDAWTLTSNWTKYTHTFTTNTLSGKTLGTARDDYLQILFQFIWGTDNDALVGESTAEDFGGSGYIDIAQVQLCAGSVALPFQPKSYAQELADCQRYCYAITSAETSFAVGVGFNYNTSLNISFVHFPTPMRATPTLTATAADWQINYLTTSSAVTALGISGDSESPHGCALSATVTGTPLTAGQAGMLRSDGTANRLMYFDAEL